MNFIVNTTNKENIYEVLSNNISLKYEVLKTDNKTFSVKFVSMNKIDNAPKVTGPSHPKQLLLKDGCKIGDIDNVDSCFEPYPCIDDGTCKNRRGETLQTVLERQLAAAKRRRDIVTGANTGLGVRDTRGGRKRKKTKKRKHKRKKKTRRRKK